MRQEENLGGVLNIIYLPARKRMSRKARFVESHKLERERERAF